MISLLGKENIDNIIIAKIISRISNTAVVVSDMKNRQYTAESDGSYFVGQTVRIQNGIVIGITKSIKNIKSFVV